MFILELKNRQVIYRFCTVPQGQAVEKDVIIEPAPVGT